MLCFVSVCRCAVKPALPEHVEISVAEQTLRENETSQKALAQAQSPHAYQQPV